MKFPTLVPGRFVRRVNRFRVIVTVYEAQVDAHVPNSGRLTEFLTPGRRCWLKPARSPRRKTDFDLKIVEYDGVLVSVDARLPNPIFAEALERGQMAPFEQCQTFDREVMLAESRIDFRLQMPKGYVWAETKSVTLVEKSVALFPDAPTARGSRHVRHLIDVVAQGSRAAVVFIVQRLDASSFAPYDTADPAFGDILRRAAGAGVDLYAWTCHVSREEIVLASQIPVDLKAPRSFHLSSACA